MAPIPQRLWNPLPNSEQTSKDNAQAVETATKSEPQKSDDPIGEHEISKQSEQTTKASSSTDRTSISKQSEQTTKASSRY